MSAELRERLYVFYERFNPENAVRVDEIARTYAGREVELWTELSRKYGPEAVELAAAEHQRRRNARYAPQPQPRAPRYDPPPQQPQYRVVPPRYDDRMPPPRYDDRGPPQRPPQQRMAPMMGGFSNTAPPQQHEPPAAYASRYAPKQQQPPQQRFGGGAARVLSPPPRSKDEARPFQPRVQRPIPPAFDAAPRTGGFDLKSAKPAKPAKPAKQPKKPPAQQPPAQPPQHVSPQPLPLSMPPGAAAAPAGNDPVSLNADVLAEISATLALPGAFTSDEELHERQQGTATHAAVCARRALERLSKAGRDRVRQGGGLLAVLGACEPWYRNAGPAGKRTASETFVLVDRRLLKALRVSLGTLLDFETCRDAAVNEVAHALQRTEAWRAALADADRARDAVQHAEEESLRTIAKVMREDTVKAVDLLYDRLSDANRVASALEAPAVFAYAGAKVATTLFNTMQVCNPESIAREDRGNVTSRKLEAHERAPTLDKLRRLIVAALQLQAITPRQRGRLAEWLVTMDNIERHRAEALSTGVEYIPGDDDGKRQRDADEDPGRSAKIPKVEGAGVTPTRMDVEDDDVVVTEGVKGPAPDVVDLTASPPPKFDAASADAHRRLATFDDDEDAAETGRVARARRFGVSIFRAAGAPAAAPRRVRFCDAPEAARIALDVARQTDAVLGTQRLVLARRMDRAIWDAFKNGDFAPIESLLAHGAAPAYVRNAGGGETALMAAAFHGKEALCRALLALGADAAATDRHGNTAAHLARARAFAAVAALLDAGAPAPGGTAPPRSAPASPSYDAGAPPPPAGGAESPQSPIRPRRKGDESHPRHLLSSRHRAEDDDLAALAAAAVDEGVLYTDDVSELECSPDEESSPDEAGASNAQRLADGRPGPAAAPRAPSPPAAAARAPPAAAARPAARPAAAPRASEPALRSVHVEGFAEPAAWSDAPLAPSADSRGPHGTDAPAAAADKEAGDGTSAMDEGAGDGTSAMDDDDPRPPPSAATADASAPAGTSDDDGAPEGPADAAAMDEDDEDSPLTAAAAPTPGPTAISADSGTKAAATEAAPLTAAAPSTEG